MAAQVYLGDGSGNKDDSGLIAAHYHHPLPDWTHHLRKTDADEVQVQHIQEGSTAEHVLTPIHEHTFYLHARQQGSIRCCAAENLASWRKITCSKRNGTDTFLVSSVASVGGIQKPRQKIDLFRGSCSRSADCQSTIFWAEAKPRKRLEGSHASWTSVSSVC